MATKRMRIGGVTVEVDEARTAKIFAALSGGCECDGCTISSVGRLWGTLPEVAGRLAALGLSLREPFSFSRVPDPRPSRRFDRHQTGWVAYGVGKGGANEVAPWLALDVSPQEIARFAYERAGGAV